MNILKDVIAILSSLSFVDYVLYFSVLALIILTTALLYVIKTEEESMEEPKEERDEEMVDNELDLQAIVKTIDENPKPVIDMTSYEQEQEQKAIISYDELIEESHKQQLNYEQEKLVDDCIPVKKINLTTIIPEQSYTSSEELLEPKSEKREIPFFHYEKEEAFLQTLKELSELLN